MSRLLPDCQEVAWQLISVNINRQTSADIEVIKEKLIGFDRTRKRMPTILSVEETRSCDVPILELKGFVCYGDTHGHPTLLFPEQFCTMKRSWESEERCTATLFGTTMVMTVYAPDSKKSLEIYEECVSSVVKVLREGRRGGAKDFYITVDFNVELGLMCTEENDDEELTNMYGPSCWQGLDKDSGGFKKNHVVWDYERI